MKDINQAEAMDHEYRHMERDDIYADQKPLDVIEDD